MRCTRCRRQTQLSERLGVGRHKELVERWRCHFCKIVFLVEYHQNGDIVTRDNIPSWGKKAKK